MAEFVGRTESTFERSKVRTLSFKFKLLQLFERAASTRTSDSEEIRNKMEKDADNGFNQDSLGQHSLGLNIEHLDEPGEPGERLTDHPILPLISGATRSARTPFSLK